MFLLHLRGQKKDTRSRRSSGIERRYWRSEEVSRRLGTYEFCLDHPDSIVYDGTSPLKVIINLSINTILIHVHQAQKILKNFQERLIFLIHIKTCVISRLHVFKWNSRDCYSEQINVKTKF